MSSSHDESSPSSGGNEGPQRTCPANVNSIGSIVESSDVSSSPQNSGAKQSFRLGNVSSIGGIIGPSVVSSDEGSFSSEEEDEEDEEEEEKGDEPAAKRKRMTKKSPKWFELIRKYPFLLHDSVHKDIYKAEKRLVCSICVNHKDINVQRGTHSVISRHMGNEEHTRLVQAHVSSVPSAAVNLELEQKPDIGQQRSEMKDLRALTHASLVASGINPHQLISIFGSGLIPEVLSTLNKSTLKQSTLGGSHTVINTDIDSSMGVVMNTFQDSHKSQPFVLATDGSNLVDEPVNTLLVISNGEKFMLDLFRGRAIAFDSKRSKAAQLAPVLLRTLRANEFDPMLMTSLVSDNTSAMPALSQEMSMINLPHLEFAGCGAHMLNLVAYGINEMTLFSSLFSDLRQILHAGGSDSIIVSLSDAGISSRSLTYYPDRFGSCLTVVIYALENFKTIHVWAKGNPVLASKTTTAALSTRVAWRDPNSIVTLMIIKEIYLDLSALIKDVGSDKVAVRMIGKRLDDLHQRLLTWCAYPTTNLQIIVAKVKKDHPNLHVDLSGEDVDKLALQIREATKVSITKYEKHVPKLLKRINRQLYFTGDERPDKLPDNSQAMDELLGPVLAHPHLTGEDGVGMIRFLQQYRQYCEIWNEFVDPFEWWSDQERRRKWPELSFVALWVLNSPLSNLTAERAFGMMRNMERDKLRTANQKHETIANELCLKMNKPILLNALKTQYDVVRQWSK